MMEIDNCLRQVSKVRAVARQEEVAYVARSRLGRLVIALARLVGKFSNSPITDRPGKFLVSKNLPADVRTLLEVSNRLIDTTRTLVQPSEPLDKRWQRGWSNLMIDLDKIEHQLKTIRERVSAHTIG